MDEQWNKDQYTGSITIAECRKVLKEESLTDEQVAAIRDFLYLIAAIDYKYQQQLTQAKSPKIPLNATNNEQKSNPIHPREYRRAS